MTTDKIDVLAVMDFRVVYRDSWGTEHSLTLQAASLDEARDAAAEWKGAAPISILSVTAEGQQHPEDAPGYVEFPCGEFAPQVNVGPLS